MYGVFRIRYRGWLRYLNPMCSLVPKSASPPPIGAHSAGGEPTVSPSDLPHQIHPWGRAQLTTSCVRNTEYGILRTYFPFGEKAWAMKHRPSTSLPPSRIPYPVSVALSAPPRYTRRLLVVKLSEVINYNIPSICGTLLTFSALGDAINSATWCH